MPDQVFNAVILVGGGAVALFGYLLLCKVWPHGACRRCEATGKLRSPFNRAKFRLCPRCGGNGRRPRLGTRWMDRKR